MVLKSYRLKKKKNKKKKRKLFADFITPAVTAIVGVALVSETASAVSRI